MKKAVYIITIVASIIMTTIFLINEEKEEINTFSQKMILYKNNELIKEPKNEVEIFLNNLTIEENKIKKIKYDILTIDNIKDIKKSKDNIKEVMDVKIEYINKDFEEIIKKYSNEKKEILKEIYTSKEYDKLVDRINEYQSNASNDIKIIEYLEKNNDKYYINDDKIIYKEDSFYKEFRKLNESIKIEKEKKVNKEIPILMYHGVLDKPYGATSLFVSVKEFKNHMQYLFDFGYTPIFLSEIENTKDIEKPIIITFDDGYKDVYDYAFPILKKYNFKANFYLISHWVGGESYINWDMAKEMDESKLIEIGSHTKTHVYLGKQNIEKIEEELKESKELIENKLNKKINTIAYPYGSYNNDVINIAKKYYDYALSTNEGNENSENLNKYKLKRHYIYRGIDMTKFKKMIS